MFCKYCGEKLADNQEICLKCGVKSGDGENYCHNCGAKVNEIAAVCINCGAELKKAASDNGKKACDLNGKDKTTVALLCFFLGGFGVHNFYMEEKKKGITKILFALLCGVSGIFALIDFVKILMDDYKYDPDASF